MAKNIALYLLILLAVFIGGLIIARHYDAVQQARCQQWKETVCAQ